MAKHLRKVINNTKSAKIECSSEDIKETPTDLEISYASAAEIIPTDLYDYLAWLLTDASLLTDTNGRVSLPRNKHVQVLNIAQDMMTNVTKVPMPKNVGLALYILKQTRSKELVKILHGFGHSISYDDAHRYLSTVVRLIDAQTDKDGIFIPSSLAAGYFTVFS